MSYLSSYHHCVFSTKERRPLITPALAGRLWPFIGGIARQNKMKVIEVGGVADHIHILISLPATISISKVMQLIKGGSSKWVHEMFPEHWSFGWQEKYGAFSVSESRVSKRRSPDHARAGHAARTTAECHSVPLANAPATAATPSESVALHSAQAEEAV